MRIAGSLYHGLGHLQSDVDVDVAGLDDVGRDGDLINWTD